MLDEPVKYHQLIPIYLKQFNQNERWLQWNRGRVKYGVRVTNLNEGLAIAYKTIDAMLELEITTRRL